MAEPDKTNDVVTTPGTEGLRGKVAGDEYIMQGDQTDPQVH